MIKCDFCSCYNPVTKICGGYSGSSWCDEAAKRFLRFQTSKNHRTQTKNVNT